MSRKDFFRLRKILNIILLMKLLEEQYRVPTYPEIVDWIYKRELMGAEQRRYCPTIIKENYDIYKELKEYMISKTEEKNTK